MTDVNVEEKEDGASVTVSKGDRVVMFEAVIKPDGVISLTAKAGSAEDVSNTGAFSGIGPTTRGGGNGCF